VKNENRTQVAEVVYLLPEALQTDLTNFYDIESLLDGKK
jgi:hypothetical protein